MTRRKTKFLFCILLMLYSMYGFSVIAWPELVSIDMSNAIMEIYGLLSSLLMLVCLYLYAYEKSLFHYKIVSLIIVNTILCAVVSYGETVFNDFEYMSQAEIFVFTSIYFVIYPPIISSLLRLRSCELQKT